MQKKIKYLPHFLVVLFLTWLAYRNYLFAVKFRFVDEVNNIAAGYFLLQGRELFSQIFFNHQPMAAWISALLQLLVDGKSLYYVILAHRGFIILWSFLWCIFLWWRFRYAALPLILIYEPIKYLLFGQTFLAESYIVYPLVYIFLSWLMSKVSKRNLLIVTLLTWFVVWSREPYVPLALFLLGLVLWQIRQHKKLVIYAILFFISLNLMTLVFINVREYFYQVFYINSRTIVAYETAENNFIGIGIFRSLFFWLFAFFEGSWTHIRFITMALGVGMITSLWQQRKAYAQITLVMLILGLSALRASPAGVTYYGAFDMCVWFGLVSAWLGYVYAINTKRAKFVLGGALGMVVLTVWVAGKIPVLYENIDRNEVFAVEYGREQTYGELAKAKTNPDEKIMVYLWDTLVYLVAQRDSSYNYALYLPVMMGQEPYGSKYEKMMREATPKIWYTECEGKSEATLNVAPGNENMCDFIGIVDQLVSLNLVFEFCQK